MNLLFGFLNGWEILAVLAVLLLLFGASRLPRLMRGVGEGVREFKKGASEEEKLKKDITKTEFI
jgi:sec-independent protein translocase protein TatA